MEEGWKFLNRNRVERQNCMNCMNPVKFQEQLKEVEAQRVSLSIPEWNQTVSVRHLPRTKMNFQSAGRKRRH